MKYNMLARAIKALMNKAVYDYLKSAVPNLVNKDYKQKVNQEYKAIIQRTEGIGGVKENPMEVILIFAAYAIAIYKAADGKMSEEVFSNTIDAVTSSKLMELSSKSSGAFSDKTIKMYQDLNQRSKTKPYKNDWVATFDYEEGSGEYFVKYTECGICKLAKQENVFHLVKYLCKMDYPSFELKNAVLDRTKTLGYEDDCCNFHVMTKQKAEEIAFVKSKDAK